MTTPGWAQELASSAFATFVSTLDQSAASRLFAMGATVDLKGNGGSVTFPSRASGPVILPWVGEGEPIPVGTRNLTGITLSPKKVGQLIVWTWELNQRSDARRTFELLLREDLAATIDAAVFNDAAETAAGHAGLMPDVVALPGSTSGGSEAMVEDVCAVLAAVAAGAGTIDKLVVVTSVANAAKIGISLPDLGAESVTVLATSALSDSEVVGIDGASLVFGVDSRPDIASSSIGVFAHERCAAVDHTPARRGAGEVVVSGSKNRVANSGRSRVFRETGGCGQLDR